MAKNTDNEATEETPVASTQEAPKSVIQGAAGGASQPDLEEQIVKPVLEKISQHMETFKDSLEQKVLERVDKRLEELAVPQHDAEAFLGGTPEAPARATGVRIGEDPLTSRHYSYFRMFQVAFGVDGAEERAKPELALARQLSEYYETRLFQKTAQRRSFLVPFGSSMLPDDLIDSKQSGNDGMTHGEMQEFLSEPLITQRLSGLAKTAKTVDGRRYMQQALSMFSDADLGIFVDSQITGELIELVRAIEVFPRIGAREMTLPPNGYLPLGSQQSAATGNWIGEAATITTSQPTTGKVELRAKKAAALVIVPNELFRFSTRDTEAFLRMDLARVLALLVDQAGLSGVGGTNTPLGIINRAGIVTQVASTTGANGDTLEPQDPSALKAAVEENDHDVDGRGWAWIMRGKMWQNILNRRASGPVAADQEGPFLFAINREAIQNGMPGAMLGHPVVKSGQVSNTVVKGSGTDLTYILGGIPDDVIIGRIGVLEFTLGTEGTVSSTNLFETDQAAIRAIEHADFAMRHENSWGILDSLDMDLPAGVI